MTDLETAARRLIAERNRNVHGCAYRADLWNDVFHALEALSATGQSAAIAARAFAVAAPRAREVRP